MTVANSRGGSSGWDVKKYVVSGRLALGIGQKNTVSQERRIDVLGDKVCQVSL